MPTWVDASKNGTRRFWHEYFYTLIQQLPATGFGLLGRLVLDEAEALYLQRQFGQSAGDQHLAGVIAVHRQAGEGAAIGIGAGALDADGFLTRCAASLGLQAGEG